MTATVKDDSQGVVSADGVEGDAAPSADSTSEVAQPVTPEPTLAEAVGALVDVFGQDAIREELGIEASVEESADATAESESQDDDAEIFVVDLDEVTDLVHDAIQQARAHAAGELF